MNDAAQAASEGAFLLALGSYSRMGSLARELWEFICREVRRPWGAGEDSRPYDLSCALGQQLAPSDRRTSLL
eukprot:15432857-Alexandrium_andersonii.AAC.1